MRTKQANTDMFSSKQAAEYLGIEYPHLFRYYVYETKALVPDLRFGHNLAFKRETLDRFKEKQRMEGYTAVEAAEYLGVKYSWIRHHLFNTRLLVPDGKRGNKSIFSKKTLDAFRNVILQKE